MPKLNSFIKKNYFCSAWAKKCVNIFSILTKTKNIYPVNTIYFLNYFYTDIYIKTLKSVVVFKENKVNFRLRKT